MNVYDKVIATVRIRRGSEWNVKPEAEQLDGNTYKFVVAWKQDKDDKYPGEYALMPEDTNYPADAPRWISSGDVEAHKLGLRGKLELELNVPESWDKFDYEIKRYSFNDVEEIIEKLFFCQCWGTDTIVDEDTGIHMCFVCGKDLA
jgi:hypothetical protein